MPVCPVVTILRSASVSGFAKLVRQSSQQLSQMFESVLMRWNLGLTCRGRAK